MQFFSLGKTPSTASFQEALLRGLAPDGSLYFPSNIPRIDLTDYDWSALTQQDVARLILEPFVDTEIDQSELNGVINQAMFDAPVKKVGNKYVLELFHGPTLAFKDVGARYLAGFMGLFASRLDRKITVLVATSGDTGGGIAQAFSNISNTQVVVLFPKGRVSSLQYEQLTRNAENVYSLEINGSFDDCQDYVKTAFNDKDFMDAGLTSANSINVGRFLPQLTYYADAYRQTLKQNLRAVVPTGNLGNITAGVLAMKMGIPINNFVAANNLNNSIDRYLQSGNYEPAKSVATMSNAMDVGNPSNLPRLQWLFGNDFDDMQAVVSSVTINDEATTETIKKVNSEYGYLLDPHTAVAWAASEKITSDYDDLIVATASPLKFADEIEQATGIKVDNSTELDKLSKLPQTVIPLSADYQAVKKFIQGIV